MTILGIKTSTPNTLVQKSEIDNLFSSESDNSSFSFDFDITPNTMPMQNPVIALPQPKQLNYTSPMEIKSLEDALPHINNFISKFREMNFDNIPKPYIGEIYFIPEQSVPIEFSSLLAQFYRSMNEGNDVENDQIYEDIVATDLSSFPETISAQIELLKFIKNRENDLESFLNEKVDSRILALIHFALSKNADSKMVINHLLSAIEKMLKFPNLAPISVFFPDFTHTKVIKQLAYQLVQLFPHHPILPSCIEKLSEYSPEARGALDLIPATDTDLSDDFSSDFFESLKPNPSFNPVINLQSTNDSDLLDFSSEMSKPIITLSESPMTMTFSLENGSNQMGMPYFQEWVESLRKFKLRDDYISKYLLNKDGFISELPDTPDLSLISYQLPVIHLLNSTSFKLVDKGSPFPELLKVEFDIQDALLHNNTELLDTSLSYLSSLTEQYKPKTSLDSTGNYEPIAPLSQLRKKPSMEQDPNLDIEVALAISDFEIAMHGRSLLNLTPICKETPDANIGGQIANIHYRANYLYSLYSTQLFSPYISYRLAFALALNLMDRNPQLASNFIFEGLYILLESVPMNGTAIARSGYLLSAEIFDSINSYYYAALMVDTYLVTDSKDSSASTSLARMATRNNDYFRAVYFYTQSLKSYISRKHIDEALYLSQIIATVYAENGLKNLSISLLSALLYRSYSISFGLGPVKKSAGTMQNRKSKLIITNTNNSQSQQPQFLPDPHTLNTSLLGLTLAELLLNERMFDIAHVILNSIQEGKVGIKRLSSFMHSRFYYKQNRVQEFFDSISKTEFKLDLRRKSNPRLSILQASTCDTNAYYLRMLTKINFRQRNYSDSLFWAEMIMHNACKGSLKEFGYGNFYRALSLFEFWLRGDLKIDTTNQPNDLKQQFGSFIPKSAKKGSSDKITKDALLNEVFSSLLIARQCFDRGGVFHLYCYTTIMLCDLFIQAEFENLFLHQTDDQKFNLEINVKPLSMFTKFLNTKEPFSMPFQLSANKITLESLPNYFKSIERILSKSLSPICIIHYQQLKASYHYLQNCNELSHLYFEFALNNIQKYFTCGSDFLAVNLSLSNIHRMQHILENLLQLMFNYEPSYINDHLVLVDIVNSVRLLESQKRKSQEIINTKIIPSAIDVQPSAAILANPNYPDFEHTLATIASLGVSHGITQNSSTTNLLLNVNCESSENEQNEVDPITMIHNCFTQIEANIRLYESEKLREAGMTWKNRKLCLKMEMAAETIRRQRQTDIPTETHFSTVAATSPIIKGIIFVMKIFDKIGVYCPETGNKRVVPINQQDRQNQISIKIRSESITDTIGLFNTNFTEFFLSLTSSSLSKSGKGHATRLQKEIAGLLFSSIISVRPRKLVPDNHTLGGNRMFNKKMKGCLSTMDCGHTPIILITTCDISCIPFETMLNTFTVIRSFTYLKLLLKPINNSIIPAIRRKSLKYAPILSSKVTTQDYSSKESSPSHSSHSTANGSQYHSLMPSSKNTTESWYPIPLPNNPSSNESSVDAIPPLIRSQECYRDDTSIHHSPKSDKITKCKSSPLAIANSPDESHKAVSFAKSTSNDDFHHQPAIFQINIDNYLSTIKPLIIRSRLDDPGRYAAPLYEFIYEFGGKLRYDYTANAVRMKEPLMQPVFRSNESNEYYMQKFEFVTIADYSKFIPILPPNLVIYSYSDLCQMPFVIENQMRKFTFSSFMFIPNCYFKIAMETIKHIFKRHERRIRYAMSNPDEMKPQLEMLKNKYKLLTTMQATLIHNLQIPIPLFMPVL